MPTPDISTATADIEYSQFSAWANRRRNCPFLAADAATAAARYSEMQSATTGKPADRATALTALAQENDQASKPQRGRPPIKMENPVAAFMPFLTWERPSWFDDILRGSIASSVGNHKGRLNARVSDVCAALHLKVISAEAIKRPDMPERSAQSIAQAARLAARGVFHYIFQNPQVRAQLVEEYELECILAHR